MGTTRSFFKILWTDERERPNSWELLRIDFFGFQPTESLTAITFSILWGSWSQLSTTCSFLSFFSGLYQFSCALELLYEASNLGVMGKVNNTNSNHIMVSKINHILVSFTDHYNAISIDRLPSKTKIENSWKRFTKIILFYVITSSPQLQRLPFLLETQKTTSLQQVTGGTSANIVLKRMLRHFLKTPPLKKILKFQERISFFIKNKKQLLQQVSRGETPNLVLKRMLELFLKVIPLKKNCNFKISKPKKKRIWNLYKTKISSQKIKPMKTYKMNFINKKNKQKVLNFALTLYGSWRVKKTSKTSSEYLKDRICKLKPYLN